MIEGPIQTRFPLNVDSPHASKPRGLPISAAKATTSDYTPLVKFGDQVRGNAGVRSSPIALPDRQHSIAIAGHMIPPQLIIGVAFVAVAWPMAWWGPRPFSDHTFFPLWLGYIFTVDGIVFLRAGSSLLTRGGRAFAALFLISAPAWWLFEVANRFLDNWQYRLPTEYGFWTHHLLASISFSTVIPAIFETAELYRTTRIGGKLRHWWMLHPASSGLVWISVAGAVLFLSSLAFPNALFPAVWLGLFFCIDPINRLLGRPSVAAQVAHGRWDTVLVLFAAGLTCGFFWEMWNYWSMPKWDYDVPIVDRPKLFEMPLLGYGGYLPFVLELYAVYHFAIGFFGSRWSDFLRFDQPNETTVAQGNR
ncbi:MAG: hypothetical protein ACRDJH_18090 [Thermomicrobiales bacterium]